MNRSLKLPLLIALALGSGQALAVDLGPIRVASALGQPLLAEIPVYQATPAELQALNVQLASGDEFARAGITTGRPSVPLHFSVVDAGGGKHLIRVTSDAAVNDPFLDLLVEVHGAKGKSVREYTILLDPPGSTPMPVASAVPAAVPAAAPAPAPAPARAVPQTPSSRPLTAAAPRAAVAGDKFGPVQRGQTLSDVARQTAPSGVNINQMLLALHQANPHAFYRDNINALKSGAVLRIPDKAAAEAVTAAAALAQVRRENGDWRSGAAMRAPTSVADAGTRAGTTSSPTANAFGKSDHLALVPAKDGSKSAAAAGSGEKGSALRQDLQRNQETMSSLQQQGEDLKSQLQALTDINSKNERLLSLKDSEIAELQQKLAAARKAAGLPVEPAAATGTATLSAAATKPATAGTTAAATALASPASAASATKVGAAAIVAHHAAPAKASSIATGSAAADKATVKPAATKAAPVGGQPWYAQWWAQVLGAAIVVLLLLLALLGRRRKAGGTRLPSPPSLADRFASTQPAAGAPLESADATQNELIDQLAAHPDDVDSNLELVSLYYHRRDVERFEAAAAAMRVHINDTAGPEWQEVLRMGRELTPAHPLFAEQAEAPASASRPDFDIDHYGDADEPVAPLPGEHAPTTQEEAVAGSHLGLDSMRDSLPWLPQLPAPPADATAAPGQADAPESSLSGPVHEPELEPAWHDEIAPVAEPTDFGGDPIDTKLDLARAYLDMDDREGARAMLDEVMREGSHPQRDMAKRLLDDMH